MFFAAFFFLTIAKIRNTSVYWWSVVSCSVCPTLCDPMDCSSPCSSFHGVLQAVILDKVVMPFSRQSSWPRDQTRVSRFASRFFTMWVTREALLTNEWIKKCGTGVPCFIGLCFIVLHRYCIFSVNWRFVATLHCQMLVSIFDQWGIFVCLLVCLARC